MKAWQTIETDYEYRIGRWIQTKNSRYLWVSNEESGFSKYESALYDLYMYYPYIADSDYFVVLLNTTVSAIEGTEEKVLNYDEGRQPD